MTKWLETDTQTNKDISSNVAVSTYTATGDKTILCQVFIDQIAGSGTYVVYMTQQIAGAGSAYIIYQNYHSLVIPAWTSFATQELNTSVRTGDVLTIYVDGLITDTTTPDIIVRWFELDNSLAVPGNEGRRVR